MVIYLFIFLHFLGDQTEGRISPRTLCNLGMLLLEVLNSRFLFEMELLPGLDYCSQ